VLLPQEPQPGSPHAARGFDLELVSLNNPSRDPEPLAQIAWKKCEADGHIVAKLGVLKNDLGKVWQPNQPHVAVRQLREWFAQFPYLSKLRDPQVLARAISEALERSDKDFAIADRFDDAKAEYVGLKGNRLVDVDLNSEMVLVRRDVADAQTVKHSPTSVPPGNSGGGPVVTSTSQGDPGQPPMINNPPSGGATTPRRQPRRFYAKVTLDPNRPTPTVSNIAQSILSELDRVRGTTITLTLDIDAEAPDGFPDDVVEVVRDNAGSLRITDFGFEGE
jgi:hypothetical protein